MKEFTKENDIKMAVKEACEISDDALEREEQATALTDEKQDLMSEKPYSIAGDTTAPAFSICV